MVSTQIMTNTLFFFEVLKITDPMDMFLFSLVWSS